MKNSQTWKRLLSTVLSLITVLSMLICAAPSFAASAYDTSDFVYEANPDGTATITAYYGEAEYLTIPSTIDGFTITGIGDYAFMFAETLISVSVPAKVSTIGEGAFAFCLALENVIFSNRLTTIGDLAFAMCVSLTSINLPNSLQYIGETAFYYCISLESVTIPSKVSYIGEGAFSGCESLKKIDVNSANQFFLSDDGVLFNKDKTEIIQYPAALDNASYTVPSGVEKIGAFAFATNTTLEQITISSGVETIGKGAFELCTSLTSVTIPDGVEKIAAEVFLGCENLLSVEIPKSVTSIGSMAFTGCESLTDIYYGGTAAEWALVDIVRYDEELEVEVNEELDNVTLHFAPSLGFQISGTVEHHGNEEDDITVELLRDGDIVSVVNLTGANNEYIFDAVADGTYTIRILMNAHVTSETTVTVNGANVEHDITLSLLGDADGDGAISMKDVLIVRKYLLGLIDEDDINYTAACVSDGENLGMKDVLNIRKYLLGIIEEFPVEG